MSRRAHETIENRARRKRTRRLHRIINSKPESLTTPHHRGIKSPFSNDEGGTSPTKKGDRSEQKTSPLFKELTLVRGEDFISNRMRRKASAAPSSRDGGKVSLSSTTCRTQDPCWGFKTWHGSVEPSQTTSPGQMLRPLASPPGHPPNTDQRAETATERVEEVKLDREGGLQSRSEVLAFWEVRATLGSMTGPGLETLRDHIDTFPSIRLPDWFRVFPCADTTAHALSSLLKRGLDPVLLADRHLRYYHRAANKVNSAMRASCTAWTTQLAFDSGIPSAGSSPARLTRAQRKAARESPSELAARLIEEERSASHIVEGRSMDDDPELRRQQRRHQSSTFQPSQALRSLAQAIAIKFRLHRLLRSADDIWMFTVAEFVKWLQYRGVIESVPSGCGSICGNDLPEHWAKALHAGGLPPVALKIVWSLSMEEAICLSHAYGKSAAGWQTVLPASITQSAFKNIWSDARRIGVASEASELLLEAFSSPNIHTESRAIINVSSLAIEWGLSGAKFFLPNAEDAFDTFVREAEEEGYVDEKDPKISSGALRGVWGVLEEDASTFISCYCAAHDATALSRDTFHGMWEEMKKAAVVLLNRQLFTAAIEQPTPLLTSGVRSHAASSSLKRAFWAVKLNERLFDYVASSAHMKSTTTTTPNLESPPGHINSEHNRDESSAKSFTKIGLEESINGELNFSFTPRPGAPLFDPGVVTFSTALRFQGSREAVAQAENARRVALCDAAFQTFVSSSTNSNPSAASAPTLKPSLVHEATTDHEWPGHRDSVAVDLRQWRSAPASHGEVVSVHLGGAGCRVGASLWRELAAEPSPVFWDSTQGSETTLLSRALFIDTDDDAIDYHVLGSRSTCRGLIEVDQTCKIRLADDATFTSVSEALQSRGGTAIADNLNKRIEQCDSLRGFVVTHALGGGTGSGAGAWMADHLSECYGKAPSIAYQITSSSSKDPSLLDGPVNDINEFVALNQCRNFGLRVLLSNQAANRHGNLGSVQGLPGGCFEDVNRLIATAIASTTAPLRQGSELVPPLRKISTIAGMCDHLTSGRNLNVVALAHTQSSGRRIWSTSAVYDRQAELSPFSLATTSGYRLRSALLLTGPTNPPRLASHSRGAMGLSKSGRLTEGANTAGLSSGACALINTTAAQSFFRKKIKNFRTYSSQGARSCLHHFLSSSVDESVFSEAETVLTEVVEQYRKENRKAEELMLAGARTGGDAPPL